MLLIDSTLGAIERLFRAYLDLLWRFTRAGPFDVPIFVSFSSRLSRCVLISHTRDPLRCNAADLLSLL